MRNRVAVFAILIGLCLFTAAAQAQTPQENYCIWPQFLSTGSTPNVLLMMDNSSSMTCRAYATQAFNPGRSYFGIFDSTKWYEYNNGFTAIADKSSGRPNTNTWDGNMLNYLGMRRVDVLRHALVRSTANDNATALDGENTDATGVPGICTGDTSFDSLISDAQDYTPYSGSGGETAECCTTAGTDLEPSNSTEDSDLAPAFTTSGGAATFAQIEWDLAGNSDVTCSEIILTAPDGTTTTTLKAFGATDPVSVNVTTFYQTNGPGTYNIQITEQALCDNTNDKAKLSDISMIVSGGASLACFHFHGGGTSGFTIDPNAPSTCVTAANQGDDFNVQVKTDANGDNNVDECDPDMDGDCDGVIRTVVDKVRWGMMQFDTGAGGNGTPGLSGGDIISPIQGVAQNPNNFYTQIMNDNIVATGSPAEAIWTGIGYYEQDNTGPSDEGKEYDNGDYVAGYGDPFCRDLSACVPCIQPYILMVTDGEPETDQDLPDAVDDINTTYAGSCDTSQTPAGEAGPTCTDTGLTGASQCCIDNVTLYGRVDLTPTPKYRDLRPDLSGDQTLTTFIVFAFGAGSNTMKLAARNGGFEDSNGNFLPDVVSEYDKDLDGLPDNYFEAQDGTQIESAITEVIEAILKKSASSTSATVLASGEGQGANLIQAFFFPKKDLGTAELTWVGFLQNLWFFVDPFLALSGIREDTTVDNDLVLTNDDILEFRFDTANLTAVADTFDDTDGDGVKDSATPVKTVEVDQVSSLWEAGNQLFTTAPASRDIRTSLDGTTFTALTAANVTSFFEVDLAPNYLQAIDLAEATDIINYVRGTDDLSSRSRTTTISGTESTWKLGDIVTSTAKIQGEVALNAYNKIYLDDSYAKFITSDDYKDRGMVYVGANDGMFHAFKLGNVDFPGGGITARMLDTVTIPPSTLGQEIWAYVPKNALPYLRYLREPDYCHIFYVDGTPLVFDASIGQPVGQAGSCNSANYENCTRATTLTGLGGNELDPEATTWRTIVIGSMRLGGACGCVTGNCVQSPVTALDAAGNPVGTSSYFAIDITDPYDPDLLWEFTDPNLGYSTTGATIVRMIAEASGNEEADKNGKWFVVLGSGPTGSIATTESQPQFLGRSDQNLSVFILDLKTGTLLREVDTGITNAFGGNLRNSTIDVDKDYEDDFVYMGFSQNPDPTDPANEWDQGGVVRLMTRGALDQDEWIINPVVVDDPTADENMGPVTASFTNLFASSAPGTPPADLWVFGGTGRFWFKLGDGTLDDADDQRYIFGFKEPCLADFDDDSVTCTDSLEFPDDFYDATVAAFDPTTGSIDGWFISLDGTSGSDSAERMITNPLGVFSGAILFTTTKPSGDVCSAGGKTFLWAIRHDTGGSGASLLFGTALVQTSTGAVEQESIPGIFTDKYAEISPTDSTLESMGRRSGAIAGLSTSDTPPAVILPAPYKRIISVIEK